jgi:hypothetical protein
MLTASDARVLPSGESERNVYYKGRHCTEELDGGDDEERIDDVNQTSIVPIIP